MYAYTVEYAVKRLWSWWLTATMLYWVVAGGYMLLDDRLIQWPLWVWLIVSASLWGAVLLAIYFAKTVVMTMLNRGIRNVSTATNNQPNS